MKRPLFYTGISFACGITAAYYSIPILLLCLLSFTLVVIFYLFYNRYIKILLILLIIFVAGFGRLYLLRSEYRSNLSIAQFNDQGELTLIGEVSEDLSSLAGNKFLLKPLSVKQQPVKYGQIQLDKRYLPDKPILKNGDIIRLSLSLRKPPKQLNPGGFSTYKYLIRKGIFSQGYITGRIKLLGHVNHFLKDFIISLKTRMINLLDMTVKKPDNEILKAIILGERDHLPDDIEQGFTLAGANHLLAISGLHVGFILLIVVFILKRTGLNSGMVNLIASILIVIYVILTGLRVSVLRAGILSIGFLWAPYFNRRGDILNLLGFTMLIILILNPYQLYTIGFQLTYLVLAMIVFWTKLLSQYLPSLLAVSISAQLGSIPLTAYYFNLITPVGILTNIWAIPLVGLIVPIAIIGLLLGLIHPVFSLIINQLNHYLLVFFKLGIVIMLKIPFGQLELVSPPPILMFCSLMLLFLAPVFFKKSIIPLNLRKMKKQRFFLAIILFIIIVSGLSSQIIKYFRNELEVTFLAVGQGDSILIKSPRARYILVDGGGKVGLNSNQGEMTILPFLRRRGIKQIDLVFITHFDQDHALGMMTILAKRKIKLLVLPAHLQLNQLARKIIRLAQQRDIPIYLAHQGDQFRINNTLINIINPPSVSRDLSRNDNCLVLKLTYYNFKMLLTGDLGQEGELRLITEKINLKSQVLKFGHHGSKGSSSEIFLKKVAASDGIISVGKNHFGHPDDEVLRRAARSGIKVLRTDQNGAITIKTNGYFYKIHSYRQKN